MNKLIDIYIRNCILCMLCNIIILCTVCSYMYKYIYTKHIHTYVMHRVTCYRQGYMYVCACQSLACSYSFISSFELNKFQFV